MSLLYILTEVIASAKKLGNVLDMLGYYKEAIASCDKAIELNPENATAYNNKG